MNNPAFEAAMQMTVVILIACLLLFAGMLISQDISNNTLEEQNLMALRWVLQGTAVGGVQEVHEGSVLRVYDLADDGVVVEFQRAVAQANLHLFLRIDSDGNYVDHRIVSLNNPVNGWDYGNGFASRQLALPYGQEADSPWIFQRSRRSIWNELLRQFIRTSQEYL